ncbi:hypothetical protein VUR80DRAFT_834 [Thermomyces stellatus]
MAKSARPQTGPNHKPRNAQSGHCGRLSSRPSLAGVLFEPNYQDLVPSRSSHPSSSFSPAGAAFCSKHVVALHDNG